MYKTVKIALILTTWLLSSLSISAWAVTENPKDLPPSQNHSVMPLQKVDHLEIKGVNVKEAKEKAKKNTNFDKGSYEVGLATPVEINPGTPIGPSATTATINKGAAMGSWEELESGEYLWRLRITSPGALWLSFGFTLFQMPNEAQLYIYSPNLEWVAGPYSSADNSPQKQLWTSVIHGDEAVLELIIKKTQLSQLSLVLGSVTHGYRGMGTDMDSYDKSGSCNVDVICSDGDGWRDQIRSVGHYLFTKASSTYVCTGTLINNTENDNVPYFLTANHCISSQPVANTIVLYWEYESDTCRTPNSAASGTPLPRPSSAQSGSILKATDSSSDFTLLELNDAPQSEFNTYLSGWDRTGVDPSSAVCIHHPSGDAKRISHEHDPLTTTSYLLTSSPGNGTHFRINDWDSGTTEGGSSGAGLWDSNNRLVGQLHGGYAACDNDTADWFGKLAVSWTGGGTSDTRLSDSLDPTGSGVTTLNGKDLGNMLTQAAITYQYTSVPFAFEDISSSGHAMPMEDDNHFWPISFSFSFYGKEYQEVAVGSNGTIYFLNSYLGIDNTTIPSNNTYDVSAYIAVFWDDLLPDNSNVFYEIKGTTPNRRLIVQWNDVLRYHTTGVGTFQAILYESSGTILLEYLDTDFGDALYDFGLSATVGIQKDDSNGLLYSYNQAKVMSGMALSFKKISFPWPMFMPVLTREKMVNGRL